MSFIDFGWISTISQFVSGQYKLACYENIHTNLVSLKETANKMTINSRKQTCTCNVTNFQC